MPELPEVETTRMGIEALLAGKTVATVRVYEERLRWPVPDHLDQLLVGRTLRALGRRGKYLLFDFDQGTLLLHLGMSGHLRVVSVGDERRKHDHVEIAFRDGSLLRFNDARRFGALFWTDAPPENHPRLVGLGPEPLADDFDSSYLFAATRHRQVAIKPLLMNAAVVVGVGNIYASEALFRAGIDPHKPANRLKRRETARLVAAVREVLAEAIRAGGTTIRDFADSSGKPGYFRQQLRVYGRGDQPCTVCHAPIRHSRLGQRSTWFCPVCQT
ncbi:MAG: bifunctional DNA-formamidopyrimidine glycosylase/DNA-(apurinic or apyrimidinic site) lyase [Desulfuromonadales bacterium]|nr:bifunctional DNA-formamidopyrimidine glycosylase/DNA-(apurinic or apyrimidinic site) lyase [Desulfuromonadales bacterium]